MTILIFARLSEQKLISKLAPIVDLDAVEKVYLIRREPFEYKKVKTFYPPHWMRRSVWSTELYRFIVALVVCLFKQVDLIMGIYVLWHGVLSSLLGKIVRKPVIQNLIGDEYLLWQRCRFIRQVITAADAVITRGNITKQQLLELGMADEQIFPIPNVFNFRHVPIPARNAPIEFDLIYIGGITQLKRIDVLIQAVHWVKEKYQDTPRVAIVGNGELMRECMDLTLTLGIAEQMVFLGHQSDIYHFLHRSRAFIMTSDHEGFPMAMVEAMACGLPCIMPDVSNIPELAKHNKNALLAPVGDVDAFSQCIHRLLTDEDLYTRLATEAFRIREQKAEAYSQNAISKQWQSVFEFLTQHQKRLEIAI